MQIEPKLIDQKRLRLGDLVWVDVDRWPHVVTKCPACKELRLTPWSGDERAAQAQRTPCEKCNS